LFRTGMLIHGAESGVSPDRAFMALLQLLFTPAFILKQLIDAVGDLNSSNRKLTLMLFAPVRTNDTSSEILQGIQFPRKITSILKDTVDKIITPGQRLVVYGKLQAAQPTQFFCVVVRIRDKFSDKYVDVPMRLQPVANNKYIVTIQTFNEYIKSGDMTVVAQSIVQKANEDETGELLDVDDEPDDNVIRRLLRTLCAMDVEEIYDI
jgi:hypothetical protein